jgi:probable RNA-binding protein EIF1AD
MPRNNKRHLSSLDELTSTPPIPLPANNVIARIEKAQGTNIFLCTLPSHTSQATSEDKGASQEPVLAELSSIFRGTTWLRRGGYVVINTAAFEGRENKLNGEIVNVVRNEAAWRKMGYW